MRGVLATRLADGLAQSRARVEAPDGAGLDASELLGASRKVAELLRQAGVQRNEPIILVVGNMPGDLTGFLGIWLAGCVAVPLHVSAAAATSAALVARTKARFLVRAGEMEVLSPVPPPERAQLEDAALIIFTSGSTGVPKGVVIGHAALSWKLDALSRLLTVSAADVVVMPLQLTFIFGIWVSLLTLLEGGKLVVIPKFGPEQITPVLQRATVLSAVPTMLRALCQHIQVPALRKVMTGGEPFPPALAEAVDKAMPNAAVFDLFGLTETGSCDFCLPPHLQLQGRGTIGRPTEGVEYRLAPQPGYPMESGAGELQIKTPARMLGYLDEPAMTAAAFEDGYFKTGDLARERPDGLVELIGRSKEIISRGGNKISPIEIDNLFLQHADVAGAMAVGIADPRLGEALHVLVVARDGCEIDAGALRAWAAARTDKYKLPDAIHVCEALPTGKTGKASRAEGIDLVRRLLLQAQQGGRH